MALHFSGISTALGRGLGLVPPPAAQPAPVVSATTAHGVSDLGEMRCTKVETTVECLLELEGTLDVHTAPDIRPMFDAVVASRKARVTLDVARLKMLDSSGVGAIVSLFKRIRAHGGDLVVHGAQGQPLAVCKLLRLERVFFGHH